MAPFGYGYRHANADNKSVEIPLDEESFTTLHRRNRRQLQNIRDGSSARIELCHMRKVLAVRGTADAIESVKKHLQSLHGPRKLIPTAVWAELMRTRTVQIDETQPLPSPNVSIAGLQAVSECRIHMERARCEVRLFGPDENAEVANELIDRMNDVCIEERVCLGDVETPPDGVLQVLGEEHGATVLPNDELLIVLGVESSVQPLVERIQRCIFGSERWPLPLADGEEAELLKLPSDYAPFPDHRRRGHRDRGIPTGGMHSLWNPIGIEQPEEGAAAHDCPVTCPDCGVGRFCVECGAPVFNTLSGGSWMWVANDQTPNPQTEALTDAVQTVLYQYMPYAANSPKHEMVALIPMMAPMMPVAMMPTMMPVAKQETVAMMPSMPMLEGA